jgi:class 3 adenylate cyclase/predicted ATPase
VDWHCGTQLRAGARFCGTCGALLGRGCRACGTQVGPRDAFCDQCGAAVPIGADESPATMPRSFAAIVPARLRGTERRVCSVLFVDLVGFTPFSQDRDPEDVRELLLQYFDAVGTVVSRYGGVVEQFIGDAVIAIWGAPRAEEGDAERAVRAALDVVEAVGVLGNGLDEVLAARAGVVTGEIAVNFSPSGEAMVAGNAVNTAARVQASARPGQVLVDDATRRLAACTIAFADAGEHLLKGKSDRLQLWRAVRVVSGRAVSQRHSSREAPLCGRETELRALRDLFHACVDNGEARLVLVNGPAGVGKSRLGWELEKYTDGLATEVLWHSGRCLSYSDGAAFGALAEMVRQRFGIAGEDPPDIAADKLAEGLTRFARDPEERAYLRVRLGRLLGVPVDGDPSTLLSPDELFAGWRTFFERLSEIGPVVIVLEDAQHANPALLDFLDHLVDWAPRSPVFVVVLSRVEVDLDRPSFGLGRNRTVIALARLDAGTMGALLEGLVPGLAPSAAHTIADLAEGLPLFAVETVRSLVDRGVLVPTAANAYEIVGELGAPLVPDSLHGLFAARLDSLGPRTRSLVADAAVLGTSFSAEALVAVSGRPGPEVRTSLAELVRREVLHATTDRLSPQRGDYRFVQDMLRQVAYATLARRDRKARHLTVAEYLRSTVADDGDEVVDLVARHYFDALQAVPGDTAIGQLRDLTIEYSRRGAERAEQVGAPGHAAALYQRAADLHELQNRPVAAAALWERAAEVWMAELTQHAAVRAAERAQSIHEQLGDHRSAARARTLIGKGLRLQGRYKEARTHLEAAVALLRSEPGKDTVGALAQLASVDAFSGGNSGGKLLSEALYLAQGLDIDDGILASLFTLSGIFCWMDNRALEGDANMREAAYLAERARDTWMLADALGNLAGGQLTRDPEEAAANAKTAVDHSRRIGNRRALALGTTNLAFALLLLGDWDGAAEWLAEPTGRDDPPEIRGRPALQGCLSALRDVTGASGAVLGLARFSASENVQDQAFLSTTHALISAGSGQPVEALAQARAALDNLEALGMNCEYLVFAWPVANDAAKALGDPEAMAEILDLFEAHPIGHLPPLLRAERALTKAHLAAAGEAGSTPVEAEFADAVAAFRRAGSPWHLGRALADYGGYLAACGQPEPSAAALDEAGAIAERLGARPLARRVASLRTGDGQSASSNTTEGIDLTDAPGQASAPLKKEEMRA